MNVEFGIIGRGKRLKYGKMERLKNYGRIKKIEELKDGKIEKLWKNKKIEELKDGRILEDRLI